jgi:hypothetical protein
MGRKPTNDPNLFAKRVFDNLLDKLDPEAAAERPEPEPQSKDPKAVKAGQTGGKLGGKARAAKLSRKRKREISKQGAEARWKLRKAQ